MKQLLSNYSISGNVVTLTGVNRPREAVLSITNSTTGAILYTAQTGGATDYTQGTNSTITMATAPGASDRLQIFYDDGIDDLATIATEAVAIDNKLPSLSSGRVPVEANNAASEVYNYTASGNVSSNTVLIGPIDAGRFRQVTLHTLTLGVSSTLITEISNDNTTGWVSAPFITQSGTIGSGSTSITGIQMFDTLGAKFFRVRQNASQTSGTTTLIAYASQQATPKPYQSVVVSSGSINTSGTATLSPTVGVGFSLYHSLVSAASTNATSVKTSQGVIGTCLLTNTSASFKYVKFFNLATAPTVGTSTPVIQFPVPPNSTVDVSSSGACLRLGSGIAYAITGGAALLDTTTVGAGEVLVNLTYA